MSNDAFRLRMEPGQEPELRCPHCGEWWLINFDNWERDEWHMCRACKREKARLYAALKQRDPYYRAKKAVASRRYRAWLKATYPQYIRAYDRERKARERARARGYREKKEQAA